MSKMAGRHEKILSNTDIDLLLRFASHTRHPLRNKVIVLLSAKAGLRAGEIAALTWEMVVDPQGQIGTVLQEIEVLAISGNDVDGSRETALAHNKPL